MLPNFFVVGAQKAATTSLHNYVRAHPDIYVPEQKETHHFVIDERYNKGIQHYENEYFSSWNGEAAVGEVDPDYMYFENVLLRMATCLDLADVKFIFLLRNPVERAFSHYLMTYRRGLEPLSFEDAIKAEPKRITKGYFGREHFGYVSRGMYYRQVVRFTRFVSREQMLFLFSEELRADALAVLREVFEFIGVDSDFVPGNLGQEYHRSNVPRSMALYKRVTGHSLEKQLVRTFIPNRKLRLWIREKILDWNQTANHSIKLSDDTRRLLSQVYAEENKKLAAFIDKELWCWK